jgi:hypothetical protein
MGLLMKNIIPALLVVFLLPHSAFSKKADTIDELVAMYDIKPCATCHKDKYDQWKTSTMGNSVGDPRVLRGLHTFIKLELDQEKALSRKDLTICLNCHVPQIKDASENLVLKIADLVVTSVEQKDSSAGKAAKQELSKLNINCLVCHNLKGLGFNAKPVPGTIYVPDNIDTSYHEKAGFKTVQSGLLEKSEFCAQCHDCPPSVPWDSCPTLYKTYVNDFLGKGRKETCQDCHMMGEKAIHKFFGPKNPEFLKSAVTMNLIARPTKYIDTYESKMIPLLAMTVKLTNNAGHTIPHG